jgi:hypothetical protein
MWYVVAGVLCGVIGLAGFFVPAMVHIEENCTTQPIAGRSPAAGVGPASG